MQARADFMAKAIETAQGGFAHGEYPIGAVIVKDDQIIATGEVRRKRDDDPTAHAEMVAIRNACNILKSRLLKGCTIYSTQECCLMCSAAIVWAKMDGIVFGAFSEDTVGKGTDRFSWRQIDISCEEVLEKSTPRIEVLGGFLRDDCKKLMELV